MVMRCEVWQGEVGRGVERLDKVWRAEMREVDALSCKVEASEREEERWALKLTVVLKRSNGCGGSP